VKVSQVYVSSSDWLKAEHLSGPTNVTIIGVEMHSFEDKTTGRRKDQLVLLFDGMDRKLGLNATNAAFIAQQLGDDTDYWTNQTITLYVDPRVKTPTGYTAGIRVLPQAPQQQQLTAPRVRAPYNDPKFTGAGPAPHVATAGLVRQQGVYATDPKRQGKPLPPPVEQYDGPEEEGPPF
jgi:hypothetical protein